MNYLNLLNVFRKSIMANPGFVTVEYFRKDFVTVWIWIYLLENHFKNGKNINIKNIIEEIPYAFASRPTIYKIIDNAVTKKYFIKKIDEKDKRKFNLFPSSQVINEFKEWAKVLKGF